MTDKRGHHNKTGLRQIKNGRTRKDAAILRRKYCKPRAKNGDCNTKQEQSHD